jgi:hypothetical protein
VCRQGAHNTACSRRPWPVRWAGRMGENAITSRIIGGLFETARLHKNSSCPTRESVCARQANMGHPSHIALLVLGFLIETKRHVCGPTSTSSTTSFGAQDRAFFEVLLCNAPWRRLMGKPFGHQPNIAIRARMTSPQSPHLALTLTPLWPTILRGVDRPFCVMLLVSAFAIRRSARCRSSHPR